MSKRLTASDRPRLIKLASELPKGSGQRKAILAGLQLARVDRVDLKPGKLILHKKESGFNVKATFILKANKSGAKIDVRVSGWPKSDSPTYHYKGVDPEAAGNDVLEGFADFARRDSSSAKLTALIIAHFKKLSPVWWSTGGTF